MRIATVVFHYPGYPHEYDDLLRVFLASCRDHMPEIPIDVITKDIGEPCPKRHIGNYANTLKLEEWNKIAQDANDDLILIDADMLCMGSAIRAFDYDFDIGYTIKKTGQINGGVIFVRNNRQAKRWFSHLTVINKQMYEYEPFHRSWADRYPGMNQSAMGYMIENDSSACLWGFDTRKWNAVECDWRHVDDDTVFVHIKGPLREMIMARKSSLNLAPITERWYNYADETDCRCYDDQK